MQEATYQTSCRPGARRLTQRGGNAECLVQVRYSKYNRDDSHALRSFSKLAGFSIFPFNPQLLKLACLHYSDL